MVVLPQVTFVLTLLLLEAGGNFSDEGRHVLFSATSALMTFVLMVISDLSNSSDGIYAATGGIPPPPAFSRACQPAGFKTGAALLSYIACLP